MTSRVVYILFWQGNLSLTVSILQGFLNVFYSLLVNFRVCVHILFLDFFLQFFDSQNFPEHS